MRRKIIIMPVIHEAIPTNPKISVISFCLNSGNFLRETIGSVIGQTYENYEFIMKDGGSTDETIEIRTNSGSACHDTGGGPLGRASLASEAVSPQSRCHRDADGTARIKPRTERPAAATAGTRPPSIQATIANNAAPSFMADAAMVRRCATKSRSARCGMAHLGSRLEASRDASAVPTATQANGYASSRFRSQHRGPATVATPIEQTRAAASTNQVISADLLVPTCVPPRRSPS